MGAPTLYQPTYPELLIAHFKVNAYEMVVVETHEEWYPDGTPKLKKEKKEPMANKLPTLFNFSQIIGVNYTTVWRWAHQKDDVTGEMKHPDFCNAYKSAKEIQKEFLIALGLSGSAPPSSYIFTAKNITDMRDNVEVTQNLNFSLASLFDQAAKRRKEIEEEQKNIPA